jgi:hypothetical protein
MAHTGLFITIQFYWTLSIIGNILEYLNQRNLMVTKYWDVVYIAGLIHLLMQ